MKYWKIILFGFLTSCLLSLAGLIIIQEQQHRPMQPHPGNDMAGVAYALAVGFNTILALCSLPVLIFRSPKIAPGVLLLIGLPLAFTMYTAIVLDAYALLYCLPYLITITILFFIRIRKHKLIVLNPIIVFIIAASLLFSCHPASDKTRPDKISSSRASPTASGVGAIKDTITPQRNKNISCQQLLSELVKSSNAPAIKRFNFTTVCTRLSSLSPDKATVELYVNDVSDASSKPRPVQNTVGWLVFYPKTSRLLDISNNPEDPVVLTYNKTLLQKYDFSKLCSPDDISLHLHKEETASDVMLAKDIKFNGKLKRFFALSDFKKVFGKADSVKLMTEESSCAYIFENPDGSKDANDKYLYKDGSRFENSGNKVAVDEFWFLNGNYISYKGIRIDATTTMKDIEQLFPKAEKNTLEVYNEGRLGLVILKEDQNGISDGHIKMFFKNRKVYFMHWWFPC